MTETLDQKFHESAKKFFAQNGIEVNDQNKDVLYKMYKAQRMAGHEIERTHDYLRSKVQDFLHSDREESNIKANAAIAMHANALNGTSVLEDVFQEMFQFNTGHRTLDANVINSLFNLIKHIAESDKFYVDGRNESARQLCQDLIRPFQS